MNPMTDNDFLQMTVSSAVTMEPLRDETYIRHLLKHRRATIESLKIARAMQDGNRYEGIPSDYSIMLRLEQIKQWSFWSPLGKHVIWLYQWGRDCDLAESSHITKIDATLEAFEEAENDMYDGAEGPCHCCLMSPGDAAEFEPTFRDRAAEQMGY